MYEVNSKKIVIIIFLIINVKKWEYNNTMTDTKMDTKSSY